MTMLYVFISYVKIKWVTKKWHKEQEGGIGKILLRGSRNIHEAV